MVNILATVKFILATVNDHTQAISCTDDKVAALEKQNAMKSTLIESLTFQLDKLESERRKYNIIIRGVDEQKYTNPRQAVDTLFTDLGIDTRAADCDIIFRMGTRSLASREQRPVMVKLLKQKDKAKIYRAYFSGKAFQYPTTLAQTKLINNATFAQ